MFFHLPKHNVLQMPILFCLLALAWLFLNELHLIVWHYFLCRLFYLRNVCLFLLGQTWSLYFYHRRFFSFYSKKIHIDWAVLIHHSLYIVSFSYWQSPNPSSCSFLLLLSRSQFCLDHLAYQDLKTCLKFTLLMNSGNYIQQSRMACSAALIFVLRATSVLQQARKPYLQFAQYFQ